MKNTCPSYIVFQVLNEGNMSYKNLEGIASLL